MGTDKAREETHGEVEAEDEAEDEAEVEAETEGDRRACVEDRSGCCRMSTGGGSATVVQL